MKKLVKSLISKILKLTNFRNNDEVEKIALGKILKKKNNFKTLQKIEDVEFKIFSQFGDDGIIQFLIDKLEVGYDYQNFIEFGVEDYSEANTKFLLLNNNWSGFILDSSGKNIETIKKKSYFWKYDLEAKQSFVKKENINELIYNSSMKNKKIGILSIDIDGNDYWIWKEISVIDPMIVIIEYNSTFGQNHKISIPYDKNFDRSKAHYSNLYWGASIEALKFLADKKGYKFLTTNSAGNNAYFIKENIFNKLETNIKKNIFQSKFRESRDKDGKKNFANFEERLKTIGHLEVIDVETNEISKLSKLLKTTV
ncbi:hypothetical protein [Candidatus Pelagibacter communis]|uniref:hypothetical protein n=1 Tax=Pelagibacter ubique TaxID=198252 RepID=UPI000A6D1417|nr:hypothetical protein [Candidatus Pelagibacter ubique]